ncbi:MAG: Foldase protein PrsA [Phycisphaerae bacterium]|nr:Foldase protein PrsA [Phycisphaerae bacterium]
MNVSAVAALLLVLSPAPAQDVPEASAPDGDAIAIINGRSLPRGEVIDLLMRSHGIEALQQLIVLELARQETRRLGISVSAGDVQLEYDRSLEKIGRQVSDGGAALTAEQKRAALDQLLEKRGFSMAEFMVGMERNAHLRKLAAREIRVDERMLREEFARTHGERVRVRHVQLSDLREAEAAQKLLREGVSFEQVAIRMSRNPDTAASGGDLGTIGQGDANVPAALREAAFALKPGEVSNPVRVDNAVHILKLVERVAPAGVSFDDVCGQVEAALTDRLVTAEMNRLAVDLFHKARIRVIDARLRDEYEALTRKSKVDAGLP